MEECAQMRRGVRPENEHLHESIAATGKGATDEKSRSACRTCPSAFSGKFVGEAAVRDRYLNGLVEGQ
jgi:hypothetical protein